MFRLYLFYVVCSQAIICQSNGVVYVKEKLFDCISSFKNISFDKVPLVVTCVGGAFLSKVVSRRVTDFFYGRGVKKNIAALTMKDLLLYYDKKKYDSLINIFTDDRREAESAIINILEKKYYRALCYVRQEFERIKKLNHHDEIDNPQLSNIKFFYDYQKRKMQGKFFCLQNLPINFKNVYNNIRCRKNQHNYTNMIRYFFNYKLDSTSDFDDQDWEIIYDRNTASDFCKIIMHAMCHMHDTEIIFNEILLARYKDAVDKFDKSYAHVDWKSFILTARPFDYHDIIQGLLLVFVCMAKISVPYVMWGFPFIIILYEKQRSCDAHYQERNDYLEQQNRTLYDYNQSINASHKELQNKNEQYINYINQIEKKRSELKNALFKSHNMNMQLFYEGNHINRIEAIQCFYEEYQLLNSITTISDNDQTSSISDSDAESNFLGMLDGEIKTSFSLKESLHFSDCNEPSSEHNLTFGPEGNFFKVDSRCFSDPRNEINYDNEMFERTGTFCL
jgi:hypothetical protein